MTVRVRRATRILAAASLVLTLPTAADAGSGAGPGWTNLDPRVRPPGQSAAAMAYDEARDELVMFPGYDASGRPGGTWLRRGQAWRRVPLELEPAPRYGAAMVYDAARGEVVLFGGYGSNPDGGPALALADTWTWDGARWRREDPPISPNPRALAAITYDRMREEVVLFGGVGVDDAGTPYSPLGDTWTWDGSTWRRRATPVAPSARNGAGMAFDEARGHAVLFGGSGDGTPNQCAARPLGICVDIDGQGGDPGERNDTWVWDGEAWTQRTTASAPDERSDMAMAYDPVRQRVVLFSGVNIGGLFHDTWTWDGATWTDVTPAEQPEARFGAAMAFDRADERLVLYGGHRITYLGADTWGWDGTRWTSLEIPTPMPRISATMAYDPVRHLPMLFGGDADQAFGDTWVYDDGWRREHPSTAPPARSYAATATDTSRKEIVLFGGLDADYNDLGDTWVWNGSSWRNATPALPSLSPLPRQSSAMAYDAARGEVVLFGGWYSDRDVMLADTWTWDGTSWNLEVTPSAPPALRNHVMAYDAARQEIVLFGGITEAGEVASDTWRWDGTAWTEETPAQTPPPAAAPAMTYDPTTQRVIMFSGLGNQQADTWAWNGTTWTKLELGAGPSRRSFSVMTFVPELGGSLLFGGLSSGYRDDTWLLRTS